MESKVGAHVLNELYGVFESVDEIDFDSLPESFVFKATHGSGWNIIVKDKSVLEIEKAKEENEKVAWEQLLREKKGVGLQGYSTADNL